MGRLDLELQGRVVDPEALLQGFAGRVDEGVAVVARGPHHMGGEGHAAGAQRPVGPGGDLLDFGDLAVDDPEAQRQAHEFGIARLAGGGAAGRFDHGAEEGDLLRLDVRHIELVVADAGGGGPQALVAERQLDAVLGKAHVAGEQLRVNVGVAHGGEVAIDEAFEAVALAGLLLRGHSADLRKGRAGRGAHAGEAGGAEQGAQQERGALLGLWSHHRLPVDAFTVCMRWLAGDIDSTIVAGGQHGRAAGSLHGCAKAADG